MNKTEPDFWVLEYVTIAKDSRTVLIVAIGGTEQAADILQRTVGFLTAPGPRGDYHSLPHGLPIEQQRLKATTASHALLALTREVIVRAWITSSDLHGAAPGEEPEPIARLGSTAHSLREAASVILHARNHAARLTQPPATAPAPGRAQSPVSRRR